MKYTIGKSSKSNDNSETVYVSNDAKVAGNLIDILFEYVDLRVDKNNYVACYIWKIIASSIHHFKNWVNKHDVNILLDKFELELKNRRK